MREDLVNYLAYFIHEGKKIIDWVDIFMKIHTNIHILGLSLLQMNQELLVSVHEVWNQHACDQMNNR
jgi:hypothetical protein